MKRAATITIIALALAAMAGVAHASSTLPHTHVKGVTATCTGNNTHVDIHLSDVPAGTEYLAVFTGALQGSPHGTTDGGDITVNFPGTCKCDQTFTVDVSLDRGPKQLSEDTPFHNVPIECKTPPTTVITIGPPETTMVTNTTTTTTGRNGTTTSTVVRMIPPSELPRTGSNNGPLTGIGITSLAVGTAFVLLKRKR